MLDMNASLVGLYSNISDIRSETASAVLAVRYKPDCNIWRVAVLEFAAANF